MLQGKTSRTKYLIKFYQTSTVHQTLNTNHLLQRQIRKNSLQLNCFQTFSVLN